MVADSTGTNAAAPERSPPTIAIRQFRAGDLPTVCEIFADGFPQLPSDDGSSALMQAYIKSCIEDDLSDIHGTYIAKGGNFWVATADDPVLKSSQVVGMVALEKTSESGEGELRRMSVKREFRRFGVGKLLVLELEAWARANAFTTISLWTGEVVKVAQTFYTRMGYEKKRERAIPEDPKMIVFEFVKQL